MRADSLPPELVDGLDIGEVTPLSGGDIAEAYRLVTTDGPLFLKTLRRPTPDLFEREAAGLRALREHAPETLGVPEVIRQSPTGLVLEWIEESPRRSGATESELGRSLAHLHRATRDTFGGLQDDPGGYLGSVAVDLTPHDSWPEFYLTRRLEPLVTRAIEEGRISPRARDLLEAVAPRVSDLCGPAEPPTLVHGDLWGGNRLVDTAGRNWLIDPACHYAHREIDIAMMHLFGGFGPEVYAAYDEVHPLADGWRERIAWYQLPPLLVHAILFGGGYGASALDALARYA